MPRRRLFFALWPEASARDDLACAMQGLKPRLAARWVKPQNLHITLAFLGDVETARLDAAMAAADRVQAPGFELMLDRIEYWRRPQVLCLSPTVTASALERLAADLAGQLREAGFELDLRPYRAHLTLARDAQSLPADARLEQPIRWQSTTFVLAESRLDRQGVFYGILKSWPLSAPGL